MRKIDFINKYGEEAYKMKRLYYKQWYQQHKEQKSEYNKQWREENKEHLTEYNKQYHKQYNQTPTGRANKLYNNYIQEDEKHNREFTAPPITSSYIVDRIFTSTCTYCGENDWTKLGCDRIDNSLPHQEGNVVCCCGRCNKERGDTIFEEFMKKKEVS